MNRKISPAVRRAVMHHAAREKMGFWQAVEFLISEGIKALAGCPASCPTPADKPVEKDGRKKNRGDKV